MAVADIDGDGDLDLFTGGRVVAGVYPAPAPSSIWFNEGGELQRNDELSRLFESAGLVSGAVFTDLDGDGQPDLALAVEWGPIRVYRNNHGRFEDMTHEWGFAGTEGWWASITTGDFDGDGKMDLAAGNWGRNSPYELYQPEPLRIYYRDSQQSGKLELIEAGRQNGDWMPIQPRPWLTRGWPELAQRFPTHAAYSEATVQDLLGPLAAQGNFVEAAHLESAVFLNRGSQFEGVPLPRQAQMSPVFSINTADFNGDGKEDLFVSQNFFGAASRLSREDAGHGLWLQGDGAGTFHSVEAKISGIKIHGEQRGAAVADFNQDGRIDLAVSQNHARTRLFINQRAERGLRVTLQGPPKNPDAIGAQMRVQYTSGREGPARTVLAGSGYWSQDSSIQVFGLAEKPAAVLLRWPGGPEQRVLINAEVWDLRIALEDEPDPK